MIRNLELKFLKTHYFFFHLFTQKLYNSSVFKYANALFTYDLSVLITTNNNEKYSKFIYKFVLLYVCACL